MVKILPRLVALAAVSTVAGCASLSLPFVGGGKKREVVHATPTNPVMETITLWEAGDGRGLDNLPTRGFAGQVMFFTYRHPTPAKVDGDVTIYVFDDQGTTEEQSRPIFQHTFSAGEWNALSLQTNLGTAYQLFVPYVRKGLHTAHCSVRVKFEPAGGGPPVYSKMANVVLEGETDRMPEPQLTRTRIEPKRFDQPDPRALQELPRPEVSDQMQSSSVSLPGRGRLSAKSAVRLQQIAAEMVRAQQELSGDVEQAAYFTPAEDERTQPYDQDAEILSGRRYQLHR